MPSDQVRSSLPSVVAGGDLRHSLEAVRDRLAVDLDNAGPRDAASLARQLVAVLMRLDALPGGREVSRLDRIAAGVADELTARRSSRKPKAAGS